MKTQDFIKHFSRRDSILRSISLLSASFTIAAISLLPSFGEKGIIIASSIQILATALLDFPTSVLADKLGRSRLLISSLFLKIFVSLSLLVTIYFSEQELFALVWSFYVLEAILDSISNSLLSGAYQVSYLNLFDHNCKNEIDYEKSNLFLESFRYSKRIRFLFPVIFTGLIVLAVNVLKSYHTSVYHVAYLILSIIIIARIFIFFMIRNDFTEEFKKTDKSQLSVRHGLTSLVSSVKGNKTVFATYGFNNLISLITLFYLTSAMMQNLKLVISDASSLWTIVLGLTLVVYLLRTFFNTLILPRVAVDKSDLFLMSLALFSMALGGAQFFLAQIQFSPFVKLGISIFLVVFSYVLVDSSSRNIEGRIKQYVKHDFLSSWLSAANLFGYLLYFVSSLFIIKVDPKMNTYLIGSLYIVYGFFFVLSGFSKKELIIRVPFLEILKRSLYKIVIIVIALLVIVDISSFYISAQSKQEQVVKNVQNTVYYGLKTSMVSGNTIDGINFLYSLMQGNFIACYQTRFLERNYDSCAENGLNAQDLSMHTIDLNYDDNNLGSIDVFLNFHDFKKELIQRIVADVFFAIALYWILFYIFSSLLKKLKDEVLKLPLSLNSQKEIEFQIKEFHEMHLKIMDAIKDKEEILKINTKLEIARQVSHDIKSPMQLLRNVDFTNSSNVQDNNFLIKQVIDRISEISSDLYQEKLSLKIQNNSLKDLLLPVLEEKKALFSKERQFVDIDIKTSAKLLSDKKEFQRVISNLVNNSFEAQDKTGLQICKASAFEDDNHVYIDIVDNGSGFSSEILENFGKEKITTKEHGKGLGLYHAASTIRKFGGDIKISNLDDGAKVSLVFPKSVMSTMILIDDDKLIHLAWKQFALKSSLKLISCHSSAECFDLLNSQSIHSSSYIFIDYNLGSENGYDLAKKLFEMGYQNLHMSSGNSDYISDEEKILKSIRGKEFPF